MKQRLINVVWFDDKVDILTQQNAELFSTHNCIIYKKAKTAEELFTVLNEFEDFIDAVIVDFNVDSKSQIPTDTSASGFQWVYNHRAEYQCPFYLYSARDFDYIRQKYLAYDFPDPNDPEEDQRDYFFSPNKNTKSGRNRYFKQGELVNLIDEMKEEVACMETPSYQVRQEYSEAFKTIDTFQLDGKVFLDILLADEKTDRHDFKDKANPLRKAVEEMCSIMREKGVLPFEASLNEIPDILSGKSGNEVDSKDLMMESLSSAFRFFLNYTQDGSHSNKWLSKSFNKYILETGDTYIVKALAIIGLDILRWLGSFYNKYVSAPPFKFEPFEAIVIELCEHNEKKGALVKDENDKEYWLQENKKITLAVNDHIKIKARKKDTFFKKDFFVSWEYWEKC